MPGGVSETTIRGRQASLNTPMAVCRNGAEQGGGLVPSLVKCSDPQLVHPVDQRRQKRMTASHPIEPILRRLVNGCSEATSANSAIRPGRPICACNRP